MRAQSFGESKPIQTNDTDEDRAENRRVEFNLGDTAPSAVKPDEAKAPGDERP